MWTHATRYGRGKRIAMVNKGKYKDQVDRYIDEGLIKQDGRKE